MVRLLAGLEQLFGASAYGLDHANRRLWQVAPPVAHHVEIVICTNGTDHLLDTIPGLHRLFRHHTVEGDPMMLGFACHRLLGEAGGSFDYYAYMEDDLVIADPFFFRKRALFDRVFGPEILLQPNRYELSPVGVVSKLYVDYHIDGTVTGCGQNGARTEPLNLPFFDETILFERTSYPAAGSFFLSARQLDRWKGSPFYLDGDVSYLTPLDSAATLSIMRCFNIYKSVLDQANFFEILHASPRWIDGIADILQIEARDRPFAQQIVGDPATRRAATQSGFEPPGSDRLGLADDRLPDETGANPDRPALPENLAARGDQFR